MTVGVSLLKAATTGTGNPVDPSGLVWIKLFLKANGVVSGGTIIVEEADYFGTVPPTPPTGTWSQIQSINAVDVNASDGTQKAYALTAGVYGNIRARITSAITGGGTVDLTLIGTGPSI